MEFMTLTDRLTDNANYLLDSLINYFTLRFVSRKHPDRSKSCLDRIAKEYEADKVLFEESLKSLYEFKELLIDTINYNLPIYKGFNPSEQDEFDYHITRLKSINYSITIPFILNIVKTWDVENSSTEGDSNMKLSMEALEILSILEEGIPIIEMEEIDDEYEIIGDKIMSIYYRDRNSFEINMREIFKYRDLVEKVVVDDKAVISEYNSIINDGINTDEEFRFIKNYTEYRSTLKAINYSTNIKVIYDIYTKLIDESKQEPKNNTNEGEKEMEDIRKAYEATAKLDESKQELIKTNNGGNKMKFNNFLPNLTFGPYTGGDIVISTIGLAVRNDSSFYSYHKETFEMMDVTSLVLEDIQGIFTIPISINDINIGDVILHNSTPVFVINNTGSTIDCIDIRDSEVKTILPVKSPFGFNFYTKIISMMDGFGNTANTSNPFGNPMMLAMMCSGDSNMNDMLPLMMMSGMMGNNSNNQMQNMLPFLLLKDNNSSMNNMLPLMMMSGMMGNNIFNNNNTTQPVSNPAPKTPAKRKTIRKKNTPVKKEDTTTTEE